MATYRLPLVVQDCSLATDITMTTSLQNSIMGLFLVVNMGNRISSMAQETMTNRHFKVAAIPTPPFLIIKTLSNGEKILSGQIGDAISFWHYARNFTYTLVKPEDGLYGNCARSNNCSGMIGMVKRNEVDFAIGSMRS